MLPSKNPNPGHSSKSVNNDIPKYQSVLSIIYLTALDAHLKKSQMKRSGMKSSTQGQDRVHPHRSSSSTSSPGASSPSRTRQINDAPVLQRSKPRRDDLGPWTLAKVIAASEATIHIYLPFFINWIGIVALIFGGCCSNVTYSRQHLGRLDLT